MCIPVITVTSAFAGTYHAYEYAEHRDPKNVDKSIQFIACRSPRIVCGLLFSPANTNIVYHKPILGGPRQSVGPPLGTTNAFKHGWKSPLVPTLTGPFPNSQSNAGSWFYTKILCIIVPNRQTASFRACLHGGAGPQVSEVTRLVMG